MKHKHNRDSYKWHKANGFQVGTYGGMEIIGHVRTYGVDGEAIVKAIANVYSTLATTTTKRGKVYAHQEQRLNIAIAPRFTDTLPPSGNSKRTPIREMSLTGDVKVPLFQSLITGGFAMLLSGIGISALDGIVTELLPHELWGLIEWYHHMGLGLTVGVWVAGNKWSELNAFTRSLLYVMETQTGKDVNGDGVVGKPANDGRVIYLERKGSEGNVTTVTHWPLDNDVTLAMIERLDATDHYWSRSRFTGENGVMSQGEWAAANGYMLEHELLENNRLNHAGVAFFTDLGDGLV